MFGSTSSSRALTYALLAIVLSVLPGCPFYTGPGFLGIGGSIVLTDLNPKALPIDVVDDGDIKDVRYKSASKYKPATVGQKDKRALLTAKSDNAAFTAELARSFIASGLTARVRLAFDPDKTDGLVDGQTFGFFETRTDSVLIEAAGDGGADRYRLEAVYDADTAGFVVRATDGTSTLGDEVFVPATAEVVLEISFSGSTLTLRAGVPTGASPGSFSAQQVVSISGLPSVLAFTLRWGAEELGKKARLYFNNFELTGPYPEIGDAETPIALLLIDAYGSIEMTQFNEDIAAVTKVMGDASSALDQALTDLEAALASDSLADVTRGDLARKSLAKALKATEKARDLGVKLIDKGKTNVKPLKKRAKQASSALQLALAQIAGFRSKSYGRLLKSGFLPFF